MSRGAPLSDEINACDIWMLSCVLMVLSALFEYGIILFIKFTTATQNGKQQPDKIWMPSNIGIPHGTNNTYDYNNIVGDIVEKDLTSSNNDGRPEKHNTSINRTSGSCCHNTRAKTIDSISLIIFPAIYFILVITYTVMVRSTFSKAKIEN